MTIACISYIMVTISRQYWKPQGDLRTSRLMANMERSGWGFCGEVDAMHTFESHVAFPIHTFT